MQEACPEEILEAPRQGRARWLYRFTGRYAESVSLSVTISGMTQPLPVAESREVRITWDMTIFRDKRMKHNRPDITVVHKDKPLVDIAVLADQNILSKEEEKVEKYQDLALEIKRILLSPAVIIIIIIINEKIDYLQIQEYEY